ncbi:MULTISPECIES: PaaI family thioesterase [unclassified Roseivivax]|uniref:PaaI family thioesterase n=1 Tax=Roseivivax sp. GX 12232 TaxID=2900547 RepID=UPI001E641BE0|nr:PaaI family thioesterase [Roseivivax sp. GX 12232]MCE0506659.1 PaaI family thioesterase [Roseivivax sp. GX 12232]
MEGAPEDDAPRGPADLPPQSEFAKLAGIRLVEATLDRVICEMEVTPQLTNRNGVLHGGAMMTLADNAAGSVAFINIPASKSNTTVEAKTNFLRGVKVGDTVRATCTALHRGRTTMVLQVVMTRGDGKQAAVTTQTHLILDWNG